MMKNIVIILLCLFTTTQLKSQLSVKYTAGYGAYDMSDMKDYLSDIRSSFLEVLPGLDIATTDNFPGHVTHTFEVGYKISKHEFGITSSFLSTAGKISYADYSGKISSEVTINGYREGFFYRNYFYSFGIKSNQKLSIYGELSPSIIFSKIKIKEDIRPENSIISPYNDNLSNTSFSIMPQVGAQYEITPHIGLLISAGYEVNFASKSSKIDNKKVDWSGLRASGGVSYRF